MSRGLTGARLGRALATIVTAAALLLPAAPVYAAEVSFGTPDATVRYGQDIEFTVPITTGDPLARLELRLRFPGSLGPYIIDMEAPASGSRTLRYVEDLTGSGHMVPNTPIEATWAAYTSLDAEPVLSKPLTVLYEDTTHQWQELKGDLVTVHWYEGGDAFAQKALRIGEDAVRETSALLGVTETEPIDFFIYGDEESFRSALGPGTRENVGGTSRADIRTLFTFITPETINDPWVGIVIPHELVHLVFDTAVRNPYRFPPRWFNEGLAVYLSEGYGPGDRNRVEEAVATRGLVPLTALTGQFPTNGNKTYLAYSESVSAIDHLVRNDGDAALYALVAAYKDGLTDDEAFSKALGRDFEAFQAGWLTELGANQPEQYGPQPAPAGPLPPGWGGSTDQSPVQPAAQDPTLAILAAIVAVVAVVMIALVVARRRAGQA